MSTRIICRAANLYIANSLDKYCKEGSKGFLVVSKVLELNGGKVNNMMLEFPLYGKQYSLEGDKVKEVNVLFPLYKEPSKPARGNIKLFKDSYIALYCESIKPKFRFDHASQRKELMIKGDCIICTPKRPYIESTWLEQCVPPCTPETSENLEYEKVRIV